MLTVGGGRSTTYATSHTVFIAMPRPVARQIVEVSEILIMGLGGSSGVRHLKPIVRYFIVIKTIKGESV